MNNQGEWTCQRYRIVVVRPKKNDQELK